ncbi:MAG TPA: hypothetical protein VHD59_02120 [Pseudolabrys sp.]|nr:hypothetical protein [Pseudolabrys sp.]
MATRAATVDRLRDFLRELPANSRSTLIVELERKILAGEAIDGAELILTELRRLFRESRQTMPRHGNAARLFYKPLEPFMVDDNAERRHPGRISRTVLDALWSWIRRDLLPDQAEKFTSTIGELLLTNDTTRADFLTREFQDQVAAALAPAFAGNDDRERRRLLSQIGTQRPQDDALNLMRVLKLRDPLAMFADHLPGYIANLSDQRLTETQSLIAAAAGRAPEIVPYALVMVMRRLAAPWQMIRLVPKGARLPPGEAEMAVDMVVAELARLTDELQVDLRGGGVATVGLLQQIHDAARGLRTELEPTPERAKELAVLRTQISNMLKTQIESMPGRVRRLLRPRPTSEIRANSTLSADEVAESEELIGLVAACRNFAGELALNEVTQRSFTELQQFLDQSTGSLIDALRHAGDVDRGFRQSQADAAVRFCRKTFGSDYAAMLTKAAELAGQAERKESQPAGA